jgi:pyrophosphatase PpaX
MPVEVRLSNLRAVLFDVDGTLVDTLKGVVLGLGDTSAEFFGYRPPDEDVLRLIGRPIRDQLEQFAGHALDPRSADRMVNHAIDRIEGHSHLEKPFQPAIEALALCRRSGLKTALVTSKNDRELESFLKRFLGAEHVDTTVCSTDVLSPKPHPECALLACRRLGVEPSEAVFIGDSVYDIRCAHDAGIPAVAVAYGSAPKEHLAAEKPEVLLETPEALLEWVQATLSTLPCPEKRS